MKRINSGAEQQFYVQHCAAFESKVSLLIIPSESRIQLQTGDRELHWKKTAKKESNQKILRNMSKSISMLHLGRFIVYIYHNSSTRQFKVLYMMQASENQKC